MRGNDVRIRRRHVRAKTLAVSLVAAIAVGQAELLYTQLDRTVTMVIFRTAAADETAQRDSFVQSDRTIQLMPGRAINPPTNWTKLLA